MSEDEMVDWWPDTTPHVGSAQTSSDDDGNSAADFAGSLIVPDIETRRGWRQYYVRRVPDDKPKRTIGYRR